MATLASIYPALSVGKKEESDLRDRGKYLLSPKL